MKVIGRSTPANQTEGSVNRGAQLESPDVSRWNYGKKVSYSNQIGALLLILIFTFGFNYIVINIVIISNLSLLLYTILFPLLLILFFGVKENSKRLYDLIFLEGSFLVTIGVLIAYTDYLTHYINVNFTIEWIYYCFLSVQGLGFILFSIKNKRYICIISTILVMIIMFSYISESTENILIFEENSVILPLGHNEPPIVILAYWSWFLSVVMNSPRFPNLTQLLVHYTSVLFVSFSGSFLFYRILTAWSLFVLDLVFNYSDRSLFGRTLVMSDVVFEKYWPAIRIIFESISLISLVFIIICYYN